MERLGRTELLDRRWSGETPLDWCVSVRAFKMGHIHRTCVVCIFTGMLSSTLTSSVLRCAVVGACAACFFLPMVCDIAIWPNKRESATEQIGDTHALDAA